MELVYQQTEVGLIPIDWEVKTLGEVGKFSKGSGVRKNEALSGDIPCIRYGELYTRHNDYIKKFYSFISKDISETAKKLNFGDILFAGSGETKEEIGKSVAFLDYFTAYAGGDIIIFSPYNVESLFLGYLLNATIVQKQKASKGQGDAVVHISATQLGNIQIPIPPTKAEQTGIATALSDADALISSLEKLIAKKRNIKQGVMQKLLQPKEGWEVKKLGEVAFVNMGQSPLSEYYNSERIGLPLVQGNADVENRKTIIRFYTSMITKRGKVGDIIMSVRAPVGEISKATFDCCLGRGVCSISFDNEFLYHYLIHFENSWAKLSTGSTFDSVNSKQVKELEIPIPKTKEEQIRIATILSDMDAEIGALDPKLEKYKKVKLGMMQNLLTGKIRLV
jgi:type I restriction enzyme, S subunit